MQPVCLESLKSVFKDSPRTMTLQLYHHLGSVNEKTVDQRKGQLDKVGVQCRERGTKTITGRRHRLAMEIHSTYSALRLYTPQPHNMFMVGFLLLLQWSAPTSSIVALLFDPRCSSSRFLWKRHQRILIIGIQACHSKASIIPWLAKLRTRILPKCIHDFNLRRGIRMTRTPTELQA